MKQSASDILAGLSVTDGLNGVSRDLVVQSLYEARDWLNENTKVKSHVELDVTRDVHGNDSGFPAVRFTHLTFPFYIYVDDVWGRLWFNFSYNPHSSPASQRYMSAVAAAEACVNCWADMRYSATELLLLETTTKEDSNEQD